MAAFIATTNERTNGDNMTTKGQQQTTDRAAEQYEATQKGRADLAAETATDRPVAVHFLKIWPAPFVAARDGSKPFEVRRDDRQPRFEPGDVAVLQEFDPDRNAHTGSGWLVFSIGYVERSKCLPDGYCAFTLGKASAKQKRAAVDAAMDGKGSK